MIYNKSNQDKISELNQDIATLTTQLAQAESMRTKLIITGADSGTIVTCTKGSTTLTATDSSGQWIFYPPEEGDWTVSGTKYGSPISKITTVSRSNTDDLLPNGEYGSDVIAGTLTKGSFVRYDGKDWIVVNVSGNTYTLMLKKITETTRFGDSTTYSGSAIAYKCTTFQNAMSAIALTKVNSKTVQSVTAKVWIATKSNIASWTDLLSPTTNAWSGVRIWIANEDTEFSNMIDQYWCSDPYDSSTINYIRYDGSFQRVLYPSNTYGFRPCIEVVQ